MNTYHPPEFQSDAFNCPICSAYAQMNWTRLSSSPSSSSRIMEVTCAKCQNKAYWYIGHITQPSIMLYPRSSSAAPPHPDMPEEIKKDYNEARDVVDISPRAASALLRLVIEKLCNILAEKEEKINTNIQYLVEQGLPTRIQQALDIVRVTGNEAIHPGVLHPDDIADESSPECWCKLPFGTSSL